jgi:hypothetical protein
MSRVLARCSPRRTLDWSRIGPDYRRNRRLSPSVAAGLGSGKPTRGQSDSEKIAVPILAYFELCHSGEANTLRARQAIFANKRILIADAQRSVRTESVQD